MNDDPIIEEVRKAREVYAKKFDYDLDAICLDLQKTNLLLSHPTTARRGVASCEWAIRDCISTNKGRVPSMPAKMADPLVLSS